MAWSKFARAIGIAALITAISTAAFLTLPERVVNPVRDSYALPLILSDATKNEIEKYAKRWKNLALISVLSLDFNRNQRVALHNVIPNKEVAARMESYKRQRSEDGEYGKVSPIYTRNKSHNDDITRLVNGRFSCVPGETSLFAELYDLQDVIVTTCRMPIDPSVGRVVGYLVIHFIVPPLSPEQVQQIEADTKVLAATIYYNEINPR